jgi:hypothetical protein
MMSHSSDEKTQTGGTYRYFKNYARIRAWEISLSISRIILSFFVKIEGVTIRWN